MLSGVLFGRASALVVFVAVFLSVVSAQDDMVASALKAAAKAVAPSIAAAKFGGKVPTMRNVASEAARRQKIADEEIVRAYNEFKASPVQVPTYSSPAEANFTERFMNLFKPNMAMPQLFNQARGAAAPGVPAAAKEFSMFAPAPPPPSVHGKPPPPPGCLPPGEPRRLWAREQVMNVDAKHRSTATMACAYECALRCSPCKDKPDPSLGRKTNNIFGATSFIERSITMQKVIEDGNHDMAKCETECTPGCMKDPAVSAAADEKGKPKPSSFLQVGSSVEAPKLTPKQTLLLRAHMAQKFQSSGGPSQLKSNSNSRSKIVKPTYADQRGISDGSPLTAHRFQAARLGGTTHNLGAASAQAGTSENGKAGAGGPWWLNPPPWWLPPPPEWGSPPPSVYSPFYSPYSISQPQGANAGQNHAPAYSPTPLPYFFLQTGQNVEQRRHQKQN
jgi:hypothetical protein